MDDDDRYREMLQRSLLTEGWESAFDAKRFAQWARNNEERLRARAVEVVGGNAASYGTELAEAFERFVPKTPYDLPTTESIFRPVIDDIRSAAATIGLAPVREIELVTSTSISPTPFARPTTGIHQLFIGLGTSAFCNYWSKALTAVVTAIASDGRPFARIESTEDLRRHLARHPAGLALATRYALYYAAVGSLLGFGEVEEPPSSYAYRTHLLRAMEVFVVAHEYSHFLAEERELTLEDDGSGSSLSRLEFFCDELGLQLAREWGSQNDNWLSFTGVGAITVFVTLDICQTCSEQLAHRWATKPQNRNPAPETHPPVSKRLERIVEWTVGKTAPDQRARVQEFLGEYMTICRSLKEMVLDGLNDAIKSLGESTA